jgi:hypothetical protein
MAKEGPNDEAGALRRRLSATVAPLIEMHLAQHPTSKPSEGKSASG